jgi:hypothetical protein
MENGLMGIAQKTTGIAQGITLGNQKFAVDTPLLYQSSTRRTVTLALQLV